MQMPNAWRRNIGSEPRMLANMSLGTRLEKMNERLLEIGRLLNGMIGSSSAFVIRDDRVREDPSIDEFF
jgi:hypothetical protein